MYVLWVSIRGPDLLREFLLSHHLACAEIAERLDPPVAAQTVFRWANGTRKPSEVYRDQLQDLVGVPVDAWFTDAENGARAARDQWLRSHPKDGK